MEGPALSGDWPEDWATARREIVSLLPLMALDASPRQAQSRQSGAPRTRTTQGQLLLASLVVAGLLTGGCQRGPSVEIRRLDRVDLKLQQLEQRLNKLSLRAEDGADQSGKPPAGVIKSLTLRLGSEDDRLRIYWADGSKTDLPCTKEQSTYVCG